MQNNSGFESNGNSKVNGKHRKLIDIPVEILGDLRKLAELKNMTLKNYIEHILHVRIKESKNNIREIGANDQDQKEATDAA